MADKFFKVPKGIAHRSSAPMDIGVDKHLIFLPRDVKIPAADLVDEDAMNTLIANGNAFPVMGAHQIEDLTAEYGTDTSDTGEEAVTYRPPEMFRAHYLYSWQMIKALQEYGGKAWRVIIVTETGFIRAVTHDDGTNFMGMDCYNVFAEDPSKNTGDNRSKGRLKVQLAQRSEWTEKGVVLKPDADFAQYLDGVEQVQVPSTATVTTNEFSITVSQFDDSQLSGVDAGTRTIGLSGLTEENFKIIDQTGAVLNSASDYTVTESTTIPGTYDIDATVGGLTSGSVEVVATQSPNLNLFKSEKCTLSA